MNAVSLREWLTREPYTLALSSGYFGFFAHCGILAVLEEENILPIRVTGSSAGALAGAGWASGCSVATLKTSIFNLSKEDFWDPGFGLGLLKGELSRAAITKICPVSSLESCPLPVAVSAFDVVAVKTRTFTHGNISDCVYASCCIPFLFQPIRIDRRIYLDGGISDYPALAAVAPQDRVFSHIIPPQWQLRKLRNSRITNDHSENKRITLRIAGLDNIGPNQLHRGRSLFDRVYQTLKKALDKTLNARQIDLV